MRILSAAAGAFLAAGSAYGQSPPVGSARRPLVETPLFAFHSSPWVNLHHFLYVTARAQSGLDTSRSAVTAALGDTVGFDKLSRELREAWKGSVTYYARAVATKDILFDSSLVAVTNLLARLEDSGTARSAPGLDTEIAAALDRAAPAYRALWWPRHHASNRRWIDSVLPLLARHGADVAAEEARAFRTPWPSRPVRVDVSAYTNWAGAYTTERPAHINVSSPHPENQGTAAFETLFHEVLHTMEDTVFRVLQSSFRTSGKRWPRNPAHPFIFYTAGEVTRRRFPGYTPYAEQAGMWTRNRDFARMLPLLHAHWRPYLEGKGTLEEAMRRIAEGW